MIKKISVSDVAQGMFIERVDSSWLSSPWVTAKFKIESQEDIDKLLKYRISHVFIDISKGSDVNSRNKNIVCSGSLTPNLLVIDTFKIAISEMWLNRKSPVDIYRMKEGTLELIMKRGLILTKTVMELFEASGFKSARIPISQKRFFDEHIKALNKITERQQSAGYIDTFVDPQNVSAYVEFMESHHEIDPRSLLAGGSVDFNVFSKPSKDATAKPLLILKKGERVKDSLADSLRNDDNSIFINRSNVGNYHSYLNFQLGHMPGSKTELSLLFEDSVIALENLAANPKSSKIMKGIVNNIIKLDRIVEEDLDACLDIVSPRSVYYNIYKHSARVAVLSLALGKGSGMTSKSDLIDLGVGAILHDIGATRTPTPVTHKPGIYSEKEYDTMKKHVAQGYSMVKDNISLPKRALIPLLQHHEKLTGTGYPMAVKGDKIDPLGRIVGIVEVYDGLTTMRPYREAMKPFDALTLISKNIGGFDKSLFTNFVNMMQTVAMA